MCKEQITVVIIIIIIIIIIIRRRRRRRRRRRMEHNTRFSMLLHQLNDKTKKEKLK